MEKPLGVTTFLKPEKSREEEGIGWQRLESKSKPGHYYYFNPETGGPSLKPPKVGTAGHMASEHSNKEHCHWEQGRCWCSWLPPTRNY